MIFESDSNLNFSEAEGENFAGNLECSSSEYFGQGKHIELGLWWIILHACIVYHRVASVVVSPHEENIFYVCMHDHLLFDL